MVPTHSINVRHLMAALLVLATLGVGCSSDGDSDSSGATTTTTAASGEASTTAGDATSPATGAAGDDVPEGDLYVSLGDSYAAGYVATGVDEGSATTDGFAYKLPGLVADKGYDVSLVNFGCGGATTASILDDPGCEGLGPDGVEYPEQSQAAAASQFITEHRDRVKLITVSIGGNDVTKCQKDPDPITCVGTAVESINTNLDELATELRTAAGPDTPIVGITYPDVILGTYLSEDPSMKSLAELSVVAFKSLINPALQAQYEAVDGTFVDVTEATGAYGPLTETVDVPPYGVIPEPVAKVCELTEFCRYRDIHPTPSGYELIAQLIATAVPPAN